MKERLIRIIVLQSILALVTLGVLLATGGCGGANRSPKMTSQERDTDADERAYEWRTLSFVFHLIQEYWLVNGRLPVSYEDVRPKALAVNTADRPRPEFFYAWKVSSVESLPDYVTLRPPVVSITISLIKDGREVLTEEFDLSLARPAETWDVHSVYDKDSGDLVLFDSEENIADALASMICSYRETNGRWPREFRDMRNEIFYEDLARLRAMQRFAWQAPTAAVAPLIVESRDSSTVYEYRGYGTDSPSVVVRKRQH